MSVGAELGQHAYIHKVICFQLFPSEVSRR